MPEPTLRDQYGQALRRWGLLDEVNDPAAAEEFAVTDLLSIRDEEAATLRDALGAVTGQCRALEADLVAGGGAVDRVRALCDRYQMWHDGGWKPADAATVAREFREALDQPGTAWADRAQPAVRATTPVPDTP